MFFSNSIAKRKGFLPCPSPFRGWTGGGDGLAGIYNAPGLPGIYGNYGPRLLVQGGLQYTGLNEADLSGCFVAGRDSLNSVPLLNDAGMYGSYLWNIGFNAAASNPIYANNTVMPASANIPVIVYLGSPV